MVFAAKSAKSKVLSSQFDSSFIFTMYFIKVTVTIIVTDYSYYF